MADAAEPAAAGIELTRIFDAPRERVWSEWTDPEAFADWFGGAEGEIPPDTVSMDVRPQGSWRLTMIVGAARHEIHWKGEYLVVEEPERLVFTVTDRPDEDEREVVTVVLNDLGDSTTEMRFTQRGHMTQEQYDRTAQGWSGFFDRIDERLAAGQR